MGVTVGQISVGMNVDLAEFEAGMRRATSVATSNTALMSAEMKRQSREGAESLRLVDEAIGLHISRPLTRVIAQIPGVGSALQSIFAFSAASAIGGVLIEGVEKLGEKIEAVKEKPLQIAEAWQKVGSTFETSLESFDKTINGIEAHIASLTSGKIAGLEVEFKNLGTSAREVGHGIDEIFSKLEDAQKKSTPGFFDNLLGNLGDLYDRAKYAISPSSKEVDQLREKFKSLKLDIDQAFEVDAENKTHNALQLLNKDLEEQDDILLGMQNLRKAGGSSDEAITVQQSITSLLVYSRALAEAGQKADELKRAEKGLEIVAAQREQLQATAEATGRVAKQLEKLHDAAKLEGIDALSRPFAELEDKLQKAELSFALLYEQIGDTAFVGKFHESYSQVIQDLRDANAQKENAIALDQLFKRGGILSEASQRAGETGTTSDPTARSIVGQGPALPTLAPGANTSAGELDRFSRDIPKQIEAAKQAYQDALTPQQKYSIAVAELGLLLQKGLIDQGAYTAGLQKAAEAEAEAENKLNSLQKALQRALENTNSVGAGFRAFFLQLQIDGQQSGKFTFDFLNQGLHGFEDNFARSLTLISKNSRQHTLELRQIWNSYFQSLEEMALKFALSKSISAVVGAIGNTGIGRSLGGILGGHGNTSSATLQAAGTTLLTAGTTLNAGAATLATAATTLEAAATSLSAAGASSGSGSGGFFSLLSGLVPRAGGGDVTPGNDYLVGEREPEILSLPSGTSGFITPVSKAGGKSSGVTIAIDARGADAGVEQRLMRLIAASEERTVARAVTMSNEINKRRPTR